MAVLPDEGHEPRVVGVQAAHLGLDVPLALLNRPQWGEDRVYFFVQGAVASAARVLGEIGDRGPGREAHGTAVGLDLAEDDPEEGGLADAVRADEGDTLTLRDVEGHVAEDVADAVALTDALKL
jgi:hypothetical protein